MNEDLARLKRDVGSLSQNAGRIVREETVAAEFIATEEAIENVGTVFAALFALADIQRKQLRVFFSDQRETLGAFTHVRSPADLARVGLDHWNRRTMHVAEGVNETIDVLANESRSLTNTLVGVWTPFLQLLRRDWDRR
jgi:hypothetical protein